MNRASPSPVPGMPSVAGPAKLLCYALTENPPKLVPARTDRTWMDDYATRHPYRCLPLNIANAHGWFVLNPIPIEVEWDGGDDVTALRVKGLKPFADGRPLDYFCRSNFGHGIVTFHTDYLFRTEPGWDILATGPFNMPKDGCAPLTGIIESDWLPYPFTMNWKLTRPGRVRFEEDEPYCLVYPMPKQSLDETQPEILRLSDDSELMREQQAFRDARDSLRERQRAGDPAALSETWQKFYFTGRHPDGRQVTGHALKLRLKDPIDLRQPAGAPARAEPAPQPGSDPRWWSDSPLERIGQEQTDELRAGRARLSGDGTLTATPRTRRIGSAAEATGQDFLCIENTLSASECTALRRVFDRLSDRLFKSHLTDPYWNDRFIWISDVAAADPDAAGIMMAQAKRMREEMAKFYRLRVPIYGDLLQIVQWPVGLAMPPHADNANPDGSLHQMAYRDFGGVTYLNDDYEGGELYLTGLDIAIKPRAGMFLGFTGGFHHEHAVLRVRSGATRLTMPTFYTFDRNRADATLHPDR